MPSYEAARAALVSAAYDGQVKNFLATYNPNWPTVIILPGGMGSQLERSPGPFVPPSDLPVGEFDPVWLDFGTIFKKEALLLEISTQGHDKLNHIIIANGPIGFLLMGNPYNRTREFFGRAGFNTVIFGYDWRRSVGECAGWLEQFIARLRTRAAARHPGHTMSDITLLAHSQGGLVGMTYLQNIFPPGTTDADVAAAGIGRFVSAGTPFYSTAGHIFRYFKGQEPLNTFYGANGTSELTKVAATLPGPYVLVQMSQGLWASQGGLGLTRYPVRDADNPALAADPHDPAVRAERAPPWFSARSLISAEAEKKYICEPLPAPAAALVHHVRSGKDLKTPVELLWHKPKKPIETFDPDHDKLPFTSVLGAGDNTVPAWGAALASTPPQRIYNCASAKDHPTLLEHDEVLKAVLNVIRKGKFPAPSAVKGGEVPARASYDAMMALAKDVSDGKVSASDPRLAKREMWRRIMEESHLC